MNGHGHAAAARRLQALRDASPAGQAIADAIGEALAGGGNDGLPDALRALVATFETQLDPATPFPRADLATPALVIDLPALERNIARMADYAEARRLALRPHAKTHKSADIARRQIAAGAIGVCCAKLGEAEALAREGVGNILITSPIVAPAAVRRLADLNARAESLAAVIDSPTMAAPIAAACREAGRSITLFIDVDPGGHRTGVASPAAAVALAEAIAQQAGSSLGGVQFYNGPEQHIGSYADRRAAIAARTDYLREVLAALRSAGHAVPVVTGGGTGSFMIDAELGVLTELQVGSYIFLDREYGDCERDGNGAPAFEHALFVDAGVISANVDGLVTVDAGLKALSPDAGPPIVAGRVGDATYRFMGDEHGAIGAFGADRPALGEHVTLIPAHCDPTVNLFDTYAVASGGSIVDRWPVTARGCCR